jgi:hypothetical protein
MKNNGWQTLDVEALQRKRAQQEATTSANVGAYPVPLGQPQRNPFPSPIVSTGVQNGHPRNVRADDPEYQRALRMMGWID